MAQECGFFNAQLVGEEYDRVYLAEQFAAYFASFIGNGVYGNSMEELQVVANDDMTTSVLSGQAWTNGWWYRNTDTHTLSHSVADGLLSRIDIVVLRWDNSERDMYLAVIEGTPSANPVAPSIVRNADYYDLQLCSVSIPAGSIRITQAQITDTRLDNSVCGLVTGVVDQIDTSSLFTQFQTAFTEWKENQQADYENWTAEKKEAYDTFVEDAEQDFGDWFEYMKDQLSEDAAGHLQNEIGVLTDLATQEKTNLVGAINELFDNDSTIEKYVSGNWQGNGYNLIPFPYNESSKTFRGITYTVNHDGTINVSGTASGGDSNLLLNSVTLKAGTYHLSGCPNGGTLAQSYRYRIRIGKGSSSTYIGSASEENGYTFNVTSEDVYIFNIQVANEETVDLVFKPMLVEINDDGTYPTKYQRYAMGNVELSDNVKGIVGGDAYSSTHTSKSGTSNKYDYGETCIYNNKVYWCKATSGVSSSILPTNTTYWEETSLASLKSSNLLTQADVVNNLTSTDTNKPLSANMGKVLNEGKQDKLTNPLTQSDVVNNLTSTATNKPLSANMGKQLLDNVNNLYTSKIKLIEDKYSPSTNLVTNCNDAPFGISATTDTASNRPFTTSGFATLITMKLANNNNYRHQICLYADGPSFWVRRMWTGSWGAWTRIQ